MKSIFLCFANDEKETLKSLKKEREEILKLLDKGNSKNHFTLKEIPNATTDKVISGLGDYNDSLNVFLFSGHASRDKLAFEDGTANAKGIAGLLKQCPKLDLVILNGCSTIGQVKTLGNLNNNPAVIATSAPVEDLSATRFSIALFKALVEQKLSLSKAFERAFFVGQIDKNFHGDASNYIKTFRELVSRDEEEGIWGLFIHEDRQDLRDWKFPQKATKHRKTKKNSLKVKNKKNKIGRQYNINNLKGGIN